MDMVGDKGNIKARHDYEEEGRINRWESCGHSHPYYNQEGEFDEISCDLGKNIWCGDAHCPL